MASWLPRTALAAAAVVALGVGVLASTGAGGNPSHTGAPSAATSGAAASSTSAGPARLSLGAPKGAKLLPAEPVRVARPAAATPAVVSALAANGIPAVAFNAYHVAAARLASAQPDCGLRWWLLAGIGRIESDHGRYGGATLTASGESRPHIIGQALDGVVYDYITDTDGGRLDGDTRYDRAVGPMQFIPSTWALYGIDGNGDRIVSPFNINDAALAAARYLCAAGGDLRTAAGQNRAVLAYNHSDEYLALVLRTAAAYAAGAPVAGPIRGVASGPLPSVDTSWLPPVNPGRPAGLGPAASSPNGGSAGHASSGQGPSRSGSPGSGSSGTGSSGAGTSGSGTSGSGTSGSGTSGSGSSGSGTSGSGSSGTGSPGASPTPSRRTPSSSAPAEPSPTGSSSQPAPGLPLPSLSIPSTQPSSTCTKTVLDTAVPVPCPSS